MSESRTKVGPGSLQRLVGSVLGLMHAHLGVFSIELEEMRDRAIKNLVLAILGAGSILLCLLTLILALLLMVDAAHRLYAVIGVVSFLLLLAGGCFWGIRREMRHGIQPFAATLEELRRDKEQLLP